MSPLLAFALFKIALEIPEPLILTCVFPFVTELFFNFISRAVLSFGQFVIVCGVTDNESILKEAGISSYSNNTRRCLITILVTSDA